MSSTSSTTSRRFFVMSGIATVASVFLPSIATRLLAQEASLTGAQFRASGKTAKIQTRRLRGGLLVLMGSGGNIIVLPGADGKLTVDSGLATSEPQVKAALDAISPDPLRHLLNTHWHFDHTDGNEWMHRGGAVIVAHENTRKRMSQRQSIPAFSIDFDPSPAAALPTVLFSQTYELRSNGQRILMKRYTPAHTDSDVSVFFENANVLHTGDTWFNGYFPFIDYDSGGSIDGMIAASSENLQRTDADTIVVPGHGDVGSRTQLVSFHNMLLDVHARVSELKERGLPLAAAIAARPTASYDSALSGGFVSPELFTRLVYRGV
jgi:glyoxylase-like metal-dependent hydrolase (beta-lactamase superfamily II)